MLCTVFEMMKICVWVLNCINMSRIARGTKHSVRLVLLTEVEEKVLDKLLGRKPYISVTLVTLEVLKKR